MPPVMRSMIIHSTHQPLRRYAMICLRSNFEFM
nr:MAG TPA: hypothetical protein [Caudoviricetes sp.]